MSEERSDDQKRDEVLKRMLATPPKPHDDSKGGSGKFKANKPEPNKRNPVDADSEVVKKKGAASLDSSAAPKPTR